MERKLYPDDLTDAEWKIISSFFRRKKTNRCRKDKYGKRIMLDAIFYVLRIGCSWRNLPHDYHHGRQFTLNFELGRWMAILKK